MNKEAKQWHNVDQELPKECEYVLVTDGEDYAVGTYRKDANAWEHWCYGWIEREKENEDPARLGRITHWRRFAPMNKNKE